MKISDERPPVLDLTKGVALPTRPPTIDLDIEPRDGWVLLRKHSLLRGGDKELVLPEGQTKESYNACRVVKAGKGSFLEDGTRKEMELKPGQLVMVAGGPEVPMFGISWDKDLMMTEESYVIAILTEKRAVM
jgi:co-chaperonin GroES (HSP10)